MEYFAIHYFSDGAMRRHPDTFEPRVTPLGNHESFDLAVQQACAQLKCNPVGNEHRGVLSHGEGAGGYMVVDAHELADV